MSNVNVKNRFEQSTSNNNKFIVDGDIETSTGSNLKNKYIIIRLEDCSDLNKIYPIILPEYGKITRVDAIIDGSVGGGTGLTIGLFRNLVTTPDQFTSLVYSGGSAIFTHKFTFPDKIMNRYDKLIAKVTHTSVNQIAATLSVHYEVF